VGDTDFQYALHLAAKVGGRLMIENQPLAVADDLSIDAEYWQWALRAKPSRSLCFSSSAAYPVKYQTRENHRLLTEELISFDGDIGMADLTYGWAKLTHEYLARLAHQKHGLRSICYRPFSGYGPDQDLTYPFPSICKRVIENKGSPVLQVWGSGDQLRDFIHIRDCVDGVLATMDLIDDGGALNLSTGVLTSFKAFARSAARITGWEPEVRGTSDKPEGVFARGGSTEKQKAYGFVPRISLEEGLREGLAWFSSPRQR
jgi:nucleoside-diphosphate-sugar epimerase